MLALERPLRSETELSGWRAQAREELASWGTQWPYIATTRTAAIAVFDWLLGDTGVAPASGEVRPVDDRTLGEELVRAEGDEQRGGGAYPGRVALVLAWAMKDPDAEDPL